MKKFLCLAALLTACLLALPVSAQQKPPTIYGRTMSNLDTGGLVLNYRNTAEGCTLEKEIIPLFCSVLAKAQDGDDSRVVLQVINILLRESGLDSVHAIGASVKPMAGGFFRGKQFICTPEGPKGFLKDLTPSNRPASEFLQLVPAEAFLAAGSNLNLLPALDRLLTVLKNELPAEDYAEVEDIFNKAKAEGVDIHALLGSVRSFVCYLENIPGNENEKIFPGFSGGALLLETADDSIFRCMLAKADKEDIRDGKVIVLDKDSHVEAAQLGKYLVISTGLAGVEELLAGKRALLTSAPDFAKFVPKEKEVFGFFLWTPGLGKLVDNLASTFAPQTIQAEIVRAIQLFGLTEPLCSVSAARPDGIACVTLTSTPGLLCSLAAGATGKSFSSLPMMAGMLLPALGQAREAARAARGGAQVEEEDEED